MARTFALILIFASCALAQLPAAGRTVKYDDETIGTASRDFSTITAWESANDDNLVTQDSTRRGSCYNDSAFDETITLDGATTSDSTFWWLTVAETERGYGVAGSGMRIVRTGAGNVITLSDAHIRVEWIELNLNSQNVDGVIADGTYTGIHVVNGMLIHGPNGASTTNVAGIRVGVANTAAYVYNNILYDLYGYGIQLQGGTGNELNNNTIYNVSNGGNPARAGMEFNAVSYSYSNNVVLDADAAVCYSRLTGATTKDSNTASDASDNGTNSQANRTATANSSPGAGDWIIFTNITGGSENLHLQNAVENDALDTAGTLSSLFTIDVDNETRTGTWDRGADEFVAAAAPAMKKKSNTIWWH